MKNKKIIDIIRMERIEPIESRIKGVLIYPESGYWNSWLDENLNPQDRLKIGRRNLGGNCGIVREQNGLVEKCFSLDAQTHLCWASLIRSTMPTVEEAMVGFDNILYTYGIPGFILGVERTLVPGVIDQLLDSGYNVSVYKEKEPKHDEMVAFK